MPARHRRSFYTTRSRVARRRVVWSTINNSLGPSITNSNYAVDLLGDYEGLTGNDQAITVKRTHLVLTPVSSPAVGDVYTVGIAVGRKTDVGTAVVGGLTTATIDYPWSFLRAYTFNGGIVAGGGNIIEIDIKSQRRVRYNQEAYIVCVSTTTVAAIQFRLFSRSLVALP